MPDDFYEELQNLKHDDEMRPKVLIYGIKRILGKRQRENKIKRFFKRKNKVEPKNWS